MNLTGFSRHYQVQENLTHCSDLEVLLCSPPVFSLCFPLFLPRADQLQFSAFQTTCCVHSRETWQAPCGFSGHPSLHPYLANALHLVLAIILLCKSLNLTWVLPPLLLHCHAESTQFLVVNFQPSLQGAHNTQRNHF